MQVAFTYKVVQDVLQRHWDSSELGNGGIPPRRGAEIRLACTSQNPMTWSFDLLICNLVNFCPFYIAEMPKLRSLALKILTLDFSIAYFALWLPSEPPGSKSRLWTRPTLEQDLLQPTFAKTPMDHPNLHWQITRAHSCLCLGWAPGASS